jgi:histone deacetylase 1/2
MSQPPGFESCNKGLVCKLHKALYGLKQAPRAWFEKLSTMLKTLGFKSSRCDPSLFIFSTPAATVYILVYVDDIIITGSSPPLIDRLISKLNTAFSLKDLGQLDYFLGIEVKHLPNGCLFLSQSKYVRDLLSRVKMDDSKGISTPMVGGQQLTKEGTSAFDDPTLYRSVVGALQYATITRPELSFSVNKVCQFMHTPMVEHWKVVKRILRYLKGSLSYGLLLKPAITTSSVMWLQIRLIDDPPPVLASILVPILYRGGPKSNFLSQNLALRLNTAALLKPHLKFCGFSLC